MGVILLSAHPLLANTQQQADGSSAYDDESPRDLELYTKRVLGIIALMLLAWLIYDFIRPVRHYIPSRSQHCHFDTAELQNRRMLGEYKL